MANEGHLDIGVRGINAFQLSGLKSYEHVPLLCIAPCTFAVPAVLHAGFTAIRQLWRDCRCDCSLLTGFYQPL